MKTLLLRSAIVIAAGCAGASALLAAPQRPEPIAAQRCPVAFRDRLLPAPVEGGFRQSNYWVWCGTVVKGDDGKFHHYASRWPHGLPFSPHWLSNSEVVHSVSDTPEGPYRFADIALPPRGEQFWDGRMTHNPVVRKVGSQYAIFYTGTTYAGPTPTPGHPIAENSAQKLDAHDGERVGVAVADSPYGPWRRFDRPILDVRSNSWEQFLLSNPSPLVRPDGSILLYYKGVERLRKHAISVALATNVTGPYERLSDKPFDVGVGAEDPTMWFENGRYHALMLDTDRNYSDKGIYYATSSDGLHWSTHPNPVAVTRHYAWADGVVRRMDSTERPQILVQEGVATHVFIATGAKVNGEKQTWNQVIPLKPESAVPDRAAWWREARLGLFIHWERSSIPGGVGKGEPDHPDANRGKQFEPARWGAKAIVAAAKAAGMKYLVFEARQPDGFAMDHSPAGSRQYAGRHAGETRSPARPGRGLP